MRKVKFPLQLDVSDLVHLLLFSADAQMTDDLRLSTRGANIAMKQALQVRDERIKVAKRGKTSLDIRDSAEIELRKKELDDYQSAASSITSDPGSNASGIYELCGAYRL